MLQGFVMWEFLFLSFQDHPPNLNTLAEHVSNAINTRSFYEKRINTTEDYALIGLLQLLTAVCKHKPPFTESDVGRDFLKEAFQLLFALPSPEHRFYPKAKTTDSRSAVYDLMVEFVKGNIVNYRLLHQMVSKQHVKGTANCTSMKTIKSFFQDYI